MTRGNRTSSEHRSTEMIESLEQNDSEDDTSIPTIDNNTYTKYGNTSSQKQRWSSSEDSSRPYVKEIETSFLREKGNIENAEIEFPDNKNNDKSHKIKEHSRGKTRSDTRASEERVLSRSVGRRKKRSKRIERRRPGERPHTVNRDYHDRANIGSPAKSSEESSFTDKSRRREKNTTRANDEIPITEILKKAQENTRTKYEEPVPLPELTTDTIYIQGRNGFSAMKIDGLRRALGNDTTRATKGGIGGEEDPAETYSLIRMAITAQKFWKCTGLVYQGLLGGMALLHFVMIHVFFNTSVKFLLDYSIFSEMYTNIFSFLIVLCIISVFDKFDIARLDMEHLHEIHMDHAKTAIVVPLYLVTFGLHHASLKIDDQLALTHYLKINETMWSNDTTMETFLDELKSWQKMTISKDLLAVLCWFFAALGTRDNMLLTHLESMEKYTGNVESPR